MKKTMLVSALILLMAASLDAQTGDAVERPSVFSDRLNAGSAGSFLRVPGLSFTSSAGFSFFSSGDAGSFGMGYYMGHFGLKLSRSLSLNWDVGIGSVMKGTQDYNQPEFFLPNVDLTYRPSDKFMLRLEYHQYSMPGYYMMRR